jgi:hypothetical protein
MAGEDCGSRWKSRDSEELCSGQKREGRLTFLVHFDPTSFHVFATVQPVQARPAKRLFESFQEY